MQVIYYDIYVEGSLYDSVTSRAKATRLQRKFEAEGWNVRVVSVYKTIFGDLGAQGGFIARDLQCALIGLSFAFLPLVTVLAVALQAVR